MFFMFNKMTNLFFSLFLRNVDYIVESILLLIFSMSIVTIQYARQICQFDKNVPHLSILPRFPIVVFIPS